MSDASVLANAKRQAELEALGRDLTKPVPPIGTTGESLRGVKGFEGITDEDLAHRATFNLKDHMAQHPVQSSTTTTTSIDLSKLTPEELRGLAQAAASELEQKENA